MKPCSEENAGDCEVNINGVATSTITDTSLVAEYFKDYSLEILYIDSSHDVKQFDKPFIKNIGRIQLRFHSERFSYFGNRFSQLEVQTSSGTFSSQNKTVKGMFWQTMMISNQDRSPTDEVMYWYNMQYTVPEKRPYGMIHFELSNQMIEVQRIYPTVINLFQKIGGVA